MHNKLLIASAIGLSLFAGNASAESTEEKLNRLEQEIQLLKRQLEVNDEKATAAAEKNATVEYVAGSKGLTITSPDKRASLRIRGYAQMDTRTFLDNSNTGNVDQFLLRTARPVFDATFDKDFSARLVADFGSGQSRLVDAYVDYKPDTALNFRLGKFKAPIGLERWQSEQEGVFIERGLANNLVPNRDLGLMIYGEILPQELEYQLALTNGTADLGDSNGDTDGPKEVTARIFSHPFRNSDYVDLQGFGVGVAGSYGSRDGNATNTGLTSGYKTPGQSNFFTYRGTTIADGTNWRVNPQAYYYNGPLGALGEYVVSSQEVRNGANAETLRHDGWTANLSYVLTGEDSSFEGVKPLENFSFQNGTLGAFELTARASALDLDDDSFSIFANPLGASAAASEALELTGGINWHLNPSLKLNTSYSQTSFDGGSSTGSDREDEKVFMTRTQFRF